LTQKYDFATQLVLPLFPEFSDPFTDCGDVQVSGFLVRVQR